MKQKPGIVTVFEAEGVVLKKHGKNFWALCPFHDEKNPSFSVNEENQIFYCFGCGKKGDVFDFVKEYKGFSFSGALQYLGIKPGEPVVDTREVRKRELVKGFKEWERDYRDFLLDEFLVINRFLSNLTTMNEAESFSELFHYRTDIERQLEALTGNDFNKYQLFQEVTGGLN